MVCSPRVSPAAAVLFTWLAIPGSLLAQEVPPAASPVSVDLTQLAATPAGIAAPSRAAHRPAPLVPFYVSFGVLQALDAHSTARALDRGGAEANPAMKAFAGNNLALLGVKAAGTAGVIYASEKMWKKNRAAAVVFMVAANSAMAWVVQHNYRIAR